VSVRLFVALDLPAPPRRALAAFRDAHADPAVWRPVPERSFHVTLAFLGGRADADVARCAEALEHVPRDAPPLALGGALRLTRVLSVAVEDPTGRLAALQGAVSEALATAGVYAPEDRPFRPHVTVGRLRRGARPPRALAGSPEPTPFTGGPVVLYASVLGQGPAVYEPLWTGA
jgi:2'-5' RNA ligase